MLEQQQLQQHSEKRNMSVLLSYTILVVHLSATRKGCWLIMRAMHIEQSVCDEPCVTRPQKANSNQHWHDDAAVLALPALFPAALGSRLTSTRSSCFVAVSDCIPGNAAAIFLKSACQAIAWTKFDDAPKG